MNCLLGRQPPSCCCRSSLDLSNIVSDVDINIAIVIIVEPGDDGPARDHPVAVLLLLPHLMMMMVMVMVMMVTMVVLVMTMVMLVVVVEMMVTMVMLMIIPLSHLLHPSMPATGLLLLACAETNKNSISVQWL